MRILRIFLFFQKKLIKHKMLQGKVYFVAAGLSDIELITRKGYQLICQANVILHDHLIPPELMQLAKTKANRENVGAIPRGRPNWRKYYYDSRKS